MPDGQKLASASEIESVIDEIRRDFISKLDIYLDQLEIILDAGLRDTGLEKAIFISHRIAGVAGTFGYPELGRVARITEGELNAYPAGATAPERHGEIVDRILTLAEEVASVSLDYHSKRRRAGA